MIVNMAMDGPNGIGKLKIITTPMGKLVETMLNAGVKLGVSSRGSGNVNDMNGQVSDFEIITVDIVATPSAPQAYPKPIYESLMNRTGGNRLFNNLKEQDLTSGAAINKYVLREMLAFIKELKI